MNLSDLRKDYSAGTLDPADLQPDPMLQFALWFRHAADSGLIHEPNAMILSTASKEGEVSSRTVLLKGLEPDGFRFFTNYESRKADQLAENPRAALLFYWGPLERQVKIAGRVTRAGETENTAYFHSRPRGSQLGAWASSQSREIPDRTALESRLAELEARYADQVIPLPPAWGGYLLTPETVEFWQGRSNRLHDRLRYRREPDSSWSIARLSP